MSTNNDNNKSNENSKSNSTAKKTKNNKTQTDKTANAEGVKKADDAKKTDNADKENTAGNNTENMTDEEKEKQEIIKNRTNRLSEKQIDNYLNALLPISLRVTKDAEKEDEQYKVPSLRFKYITKHPYKEMKKIIESVRKKLEVRGITVQLVENIDIKGTSAEKFYIKIEDDNGSYSILDLIEYQNNIYDYSVNEEETIKKHLLNIKGVYTAEIVNISKLVAQYISLCLSYKETFYYRYKFIGWDRLDGNVIFKYDTMYSNRNIPLQGFCGEPWAQELVSEDRNDEDGSIYSKMMGLTFTDRVLPSIILCAAVSGVVRQILPFTKETNINMNIVAEKASGKSTLQHFILSFFGNPKYLEGSFIDTEASMESLRAERSIIPYMLDERLLKVEGDSENKKSIGLLMDIFKEYEGRVRQRYGSQYSDKGNRAYGAVISSSVESVLDQIKPSKNRVSNDLGQYRRFIELYADKGELTIDAEHAKVLELFAYSIYGYGVTWLAEYMLAVMKYVPRYMKYAGRERVSATEGFSIVDAIFLKNLFPTEITEESYKNVKTVKMLEKISRLDAKMIKYIEFIHVCDDYPDMENPEIWINFFDDYVKKVKAIAEKEKKYEGITGELEGSYKRFALLALTGELLNSCIGNKDIADKDKTAEKIRFHIDVDRMIEYLLDNLYNKLLNANVLYRPEKKKMTAEEKAEYYKGKIIKLYDWIDANREYFFEANKGRAECIGHYSTIKGSDNVEVTFFHEMPLETVINNLDQNADDIRNKLYHKGAVVLKDEMRTAEFNEFLDTMKDFIYVSREKVQRNYMKGKTKRGNVYVLLVNAIKKLKTVGEVTDNETV